MFTAAGIFMGRLFWRYSFKWHDFFFVVLLLAVCFFHLGPIRVFLKK